MSGRLSGRLSATLVGWQRYPLDRANFKGPVRKTKLIAQAARLRPPGQADGEDGVMGNRLKQLVVQARRKGSRLAPALLLFLSGCATAVSAGVNPALDGADLIAITDDIAAQLGGSPAVAEAIEANGGRPLRVVVQPVVNMLRAEVIPKGPADAFTARVRMLLSRTARDRFVWVMNRDAYYSLRAAELDGIDLGPAPEAVDPDYALTATFHSLSDENRAGRTSYYLCVYDLTDLRSRQQLWSGRYEIRKSAVRQFLD